MASFQWEDQSELNFSLGFNSCVWLGAAPIRWKHFNGGYCKLLFLCHSSFSLSCWDWYLQKNIHFFYFIDILFWFSGMKSLIQDGHLKMLGGYLEFFMKPAVAEMYRSLRRELDALIQNKVSDALQKPYVQKLFLFTLVTSLHRFGVVPCLLDEWQITHFCLVMQYIFQKYEDH